MKNSILMASGALIAFVAGSAQAQQSAGNVPGAPPELTEVVVTAQRREEPLREVPISATVTSGLQLQERNIFSLKDLADRLPNVKISEGSVDLINVRGVGSGQNAGFEQAVGTFVDGVYRGRSRAVRAALFDVEQVEVLKGPQTTYFGNNAIAGALNITTRKPGDSFDYNASALYGSTIGEYSVEGGVTAPLTDTLSIRVAAKAFGEDGWTHNLITDRYGPHDNNWIGRVSLAWKPTDNWRTDIRVDHDHKRSNDSGSELLHCPPDPIYGGANGLCAAQLVATGGLNESVIDRKSATTEVTFERYDFTEAAATNRLTLGKFNLTFLTSFYKQSDDLAPPVGPFDVPGIGGTASPEPASFNEDYHQFAQEVRLESPGGEFVDYMLGAYFASGKLDQPSYFGFFFAPFGLFAGPPYTFNTPVAARIAFDQDDRTYSGFGAATVHITDAFRFNAGLRYSVIEKTAHSFTTFGTGTAPITPATYIEGPPSVNAALAPFLGASLDDFPDTHRRDSKLMPSASLQYDLTANIMAYVSYTNGFKAGGFGVAFGRNTFAPEKVNAYEIGIKGSALQHKLNYSLAAFDSKYDNLQENTNIPLPSGALISQITNVAKAESKGVEASTTWRANEYLSFNADLAYLRSLYENYHDAPCTILQAQLVTNCTQDLSGRARAFAPNVSGSVGARLSIPLPRDLALRLAPSFYFTSEYNEAATLDPLMRQSGYGKVDLRASVGSSNGRWEVAMLAKNLTDKATSSYANTPVGVFGSTYALTDPPRTIAVQVSVQK